MFRIRPEVTQSICLLGTIPGGINGKQFQALSKPFQSLLTAPFQVFFNLGIDVGHHISSMSQLSPLTHDNLISFSQFVQKMKSTFGFDLEQSR